MVVYRRQHPTVPNLQIPDHTDPIGFSDASIGVLGARPIAVNLDPNRRAVRLNHHRQNFALLVIDMQLGFDEPAWGPRNNPDAERNVAALIAAWRAAGAPIIHVHHDSPDPSGHFRRGTPGHAVKAEARPAPGETVYRKTVNSAFIGTSLEADLRRAGIGRLAIVGLTTNHCVSTTARMAGNLGFETFVAADATATFDRANLDGTVRPAAEVHASALSDVQDEFARIVDTSWLIASVHDQAGRAVRPQEAEHA